MYKIDIDSIKQFIDDLAQQCNSRREFLCSMNRVEERLSKIDDGTDDAKFVIALLVDYFCAYIGVLVEEENNNPNGIHEAFGEVHKASQRLTDACRYCHERWHSEHQHQYYF